jgi:hypothetical protein
MLNTYLIRTSRSFFLQIKRSVNKGITPVWDPVGICLINIDIRIYWLFYKVPIIY